ncbi:hypothetical protein HKCCE4037_11280, partial [Rhodobacterales bacterium HKCCE4037]|nr:hypothetical protein [Rhodobacterales bacterium HKCCE4037]
MPASDTRTVLARKIAIHGGAGLQSDDLVPKLEVGLGRAVRRAAAPLEGFPVRIDGCEIALRADLDAAIAALPEHGLVAATEDPTGHRGLLALEYTLVDALIEVQTTGRVEETQGPPRPVTRIDEALCRDFIDMVFAAFALETSEIAGRDWPGRITYGSQIKDRSQINLLLPARGYHLMQITVTAGGRKSGRMVVLLPADPALARQTALKAEKKKAPRPETWADDVLRALGGAPLALNAVLMRMQMPLAKVEALADGDLIPFDHADLGSVSLESDGGHVFMRGKLGQLGGRRAVRLGAGTAPGPRAVAPVAGP